MPRFFIRDDSLCRDEIPERLTINGADAFHISHVLRCRKGEALSVSDGAGRLFSCRIESITPDTVILKVDSAAEDVGEPNVKVTLFQALIKGDKFDAVIQKSVECGVSRIVPVICERCVSRLDEAAALKKLGRWQKIADEAAKQCGRGILPKVEEPVSFGEALEKMKESEFAFMCYEGANVIPIKELISSGRRSSYSFIIGPEGGFSDEECARASEFFPLCGLGKRILRTETAPIVVLSALMYETDNL